MANNRLHRMLLAVVVVCLSFLQRQQLLLLCEAKRRKDASDSDDGEDENGHKHKRTRRSYERTEYSACGWSMMLQQTAKLEDPSSKEANCFRRRFRVPYPFFVELVKDIKKEKWVGFTTDKTEFGGRGTRPCIPVELKVLASLQILGRGNYFDDIPQMGGMSESTAQRVFHNFTCQFSRTYYKKWVPFPEGDNLAQILQDYYELGLPGAMGSTDVTHIHWAQAPHSLRCSYQGKEGYPTLAYQCTVDQSGRCLGATKGFPGAQNDKTIVRFDNFITRVREDHKDFEYTLYDADGNEYTEHGLYCIVDGGYHLWRILQCPFSKPMNRAEIDFREQHEAVRKDVECFFGILKGRFRILKLPCLYRTQDRMDNVFFTCCILHNMLHSFDGIKLLEAGINYAEYDGDVDCWREQPQAPPLRRSVPAEKVEQESGFFSLRKKLLINFTFRNKEGTVTWKRS